jgi:hypothetical protein
MFTLPLPHTGTKYPIDYPLIIHTTVTTTGNRKEWSKTVISSSLGGKKGSSKITAG